MAGDITLSDTRLSAMQTYYLYVLYFVLIALILIILYNKKKSKILQGSFFMIGNVLHYFNRVAQLK